MKKRVLLKNKKVYKFYAVISYAISNIRILGDFDDDSMNLDM